MIIINIVKELISSPRFVMIAIAVLALVIIPLTIVQVQNQQDNRQRAEEIAWVTDQSAVTACPAAGTGAEITVKFTNAEPKKSSTDMVVVAKDLQTGKSVDVGVVQGGETKTNIIKTEKSTLAAGSVQFSLTWADGHSGVDSRTAAYKAVTSCITPTSTPTPPVKITPTPLPSGVPSPTPTICPTLGPVQNVKIDCPNCP